MAANTKQNPAKSAASSTGKPLMMKEVNAAGEHTSTLALLRHAGVDLKENGKVSIRFWLLVCPAKSY